MNPIIKGIMFFNIIKSALAAEATKVNPNASLPSVDEELKVTGKWTDADLAYVVNYLNAIIKIALDIAVVVGCIMIFWSAFLYVTSFGDESKAETAKKTLLWSIVGTIVVALARVLQTTVQSWISASKT